MKSKAIVILLVASATVAALVAYDLMVMHATGLPSQSWMDFGCSDNPQDAANCQKVLVSPYAYIPPKHPDSPPGEWHWPAAFLGLVYYSAIALWFIGAGAPRRRNWLWVPMIVVALGLLSSGWFMWLMFSGKLDAWCPRCVVTHALNLLIGVGLGLLWVWTPAAPGIPEVAARDAGAATRAAVAPSWRTVLMTLIAIAAISVAHLNALAVKTWRKTAEAAAGNLETYQKQVNAVLKDPVLLATHWERTEERPISIRPDDPVRQYFAEATQPPLDVVIFSDFECPSCAAFARFFEAQVVPLFGGFVQVTYKHYPIDQKCNPMSAGTLHPHACEASKMAEAARLLGGNSAFERAHDYLFNNRDQLAKGTLTAEQLAADLKLDSAALTEKMKDPQVEERIVADARLARSLGVTGTPAVFVQGRALAPFSKANIGFWNTLADMYWNGVGKPRPESTQQKSRSATPVEGS